MSMAQTMDIRRVDQLPVGKLGIWLFLLMDGLSFATILIGAAYLRANGALWPRAGTVLNVPLTAVNTVVLFLSSFTMMLALQAVRADDQRGFKKNLFLTLALGALFLGIQAYEYTHFIVGGEHLKTALAAAGFEGQHFFRPGSSIYAACFYGATGFHGLHVFAGLIFMIYIIALALRGRWSAAHHGRVEVLTLYWHFVDLMWMFVFTVVYLL
ncbi:MAG: heme-copper oxidase subunit III [Candidatus Omnitrophica bacterium]|nr:heme-copper oxidase subunit III [Candidatus Omnitrophota bacterium]